MLFGLVALLWKSPELLRSAPPGPYGTVVGDVYAYGIILQEIVLHDGPYARDTELEYSGEIYLLFYLQQQSIWKSYIYSTEPCMPVSVA